ncbi:MAG: hypothetical protein B7Y86_02820 [Brevundimonas subvibrioides]|uniref:Uncharacterized protein n=1 Tax=Brevundimonas subvibrioides TaxID=74313 RepID=A0A258HQM4_9CAUL|nr:MAG: hypothetical protein B7Y86_02820 [Brevundimonas subvibrioides]
MKARQKTTPAATRLPTPATTRSRVRFRLGGGLGRDRLVLARPSFQRRSRLRTVNRLPAGVRA